MNGEPRSLALLRAANPARPDQAAVHSPNAHALLARIVAEPRGQAHAGPRLRRLRGRISSRARVALSGAGISAAAAAIIVAVLSGSTATPAFAGWTPTPSVASAKQITALKRWCGLTNPVLVEVRGPYTAAVFASATGGTACVLGPSMSFAGSVGGARGYHIKADQIGMAVETSADSKGHGFVLATGRVGSSVRAVVIHRRHRSPVIATARHGWYLAWWPASTHATGVTVTTGSGRRSMPLPGLARTGSTCNIPSHTGRGEMCGSAYNGNGPGSDGVPGPPMIGSPIVKPFHGILLFNVWNATSVRVCFHPPANTTAALQPHGPTGPCAHASLVTRLPRGYPVQHNLLEVLPNGVWEIRLPADLRHRLSFPVLAIGHNPRFGDGVRTEFTVYRRG